MLTSFFVVLMLVYYAWYDDPENQHIKNLVDKCDACTKGFFFINSRRVFLSKYLGVLIIVLKCLGVLEW